MTVRLHTMPTKLISGSNKILNSDACGQFVLSLYIIFHPVIQGKGKRECCKVLKGRVVPGFGLKSKN